MIERLNHMKECLMGQVQSQMGHLECVDAKELGEAIDMIKDLEEAIYYCTITESMNNGFKGKNGGEQEMEIHYYPMMMPYNDNGDRMMNPYDRNRMYYRDGGENNGNEGRDGRVDYYNGNRGGRNSNSGNNNGGNGRNYFNGNGYEYPVELRDFREGRSPKTRRMYMESKEKHHDKTVQMQELEQYMKELSTDVVEMIEGSSPEEKQLLKSKLTTLISKIDHA